MEELLQYFPELTFTQQRQFKALALLYKNWNIKINVISRKDIEHLYVRHVIHSLGVAKVLPFLPEAKVLDVGTGGGFPGIPLAILFPRTRFHLVDSTGKKLKVVKAVRDSLGLKNVEVSHLRAEKVEGLYDFVVSRGVTNMPTFVGWVREKIATRSFHQLKNGILYLKGGDLTEELRSFPRAREYPLGQYFEEDFFETKKLVYLPLG